MAKNELDNESTFAHFVRRRKKKKPLVNMEQGDPSEAQKLLQVHL